MGKPLDFLSILRNYQIQLGGNTDFQYSVNIDVFQLNLNAYECHVCLLQEILRSSYFNNILTI